MENKKAIQGIMDLKWLRYRSQCGQDIAIDNLFQQMCGGVFVECGAFDGEEYSNTCFLERARNWTGLCVEPNPDSFAKLEVSRTCHKLNAALGNRNGVAEFIAANGGIAGCSRLAECGNVDGLKVFQKCHGGSWETIEVQIVRTQDALDKFGITKIDYFSLDTDGNELDVLAGVDFDKTTITAMTVENCEDSDEMRDAVCKYGFEFIKQIQWDDFYINPRMFTK